LKNELFEGIEFESEEAAKLFYVNYARLNGFRARISRYGRPRCVRLDPMRSDRVELTKWISNR
jgi:hypothetical protein